VALCHPSRYTSPTTRAGRASVGRVILIAALLAAIIVWFSETGDSPSRTTDTISQAPTYTPPDVETLRKGLSQMEENLKDPEYIKLLECSGINPYRGSPPPGHPPTKAECERILGQAPAPVASTQNTSDLSRAKQKLRDEMIGPNSKIPRETADPSKPNWHIIETLDGTIYKIDTNSIGRGQGSIAQAMVYVVTGDIVRPSKFQFDCRAHHFWVFDENYRIGPEQYAQPLSVAGKIESVACVGVR
jgi:hypothetical protein